MTPRRPRTRYETNGHLVEAFLEATFIQTKGEWVGQPLRLEQWQREFLREAFLVDPARGNLRVYDTVVLGLPAKCGKSSLSSGVMLFLLMADHVGGMLEGSPEVYAVANSKEQAGAVFNQARESVQASPPLTARLEVQRSLIWNPANSGRFRALAADVKNVHGVNPSAIVIDELGSATDDRMLVAMQKSVTARRQPITMVISHTGEERYGPLGAMYDDALASPKIEVYGKRKGEPLLQIVRDRERGFLFWWYGLQGGYDPEDPEVWAKCNPASWKTPEVLFKQRHKPGYSFTEFQRYDLNAWVAASDEFLPPGAFVACGNEDLSIPKGADVWLGVDAARKDDCGAVAICQPHVRPDGEVEYRLVTHILDHPPGAQSMGERLELLIRKLDRRYKIREVHYDPHVFVRSADMLEAEGFEMAEFPQTDARMVPATRLFREAVITRRVTHDADRVLIEHVGHTITKQCDRGERVDKKKSRHKIDGCVASLMAVAATQNAISRGDWGKSKRVQIIPIG